MSEPHGHLEGNDEAVQAHLKRLRRIEGQVRGIQRMVEQTSAFRPGIYN